MRICMCMCVGVVTEIDVSYLFLSMLVFESVRLAGKLQGSTIFAPGAMA